MGTIDGSATLAELAVERPARTRVFEELGLEYCCGGKKRLDEACASRGLDVATVAVLLETVEPVADEVDWSRAPIGDLCDHIVSEHHELLRIELPHLSTLLDKVVRAHGADRPDLLELRDGFEKLRAELEAHIVEEERSLFPPARSAESGAADLPALRALEHDHEDTGAALAGLRQLTDDYRLDRALCNTHRAALDTLARVERDLHLHVHEENNILFPRLRSAWGLEPA